MKRLIIIIILFISLLSSCLSFINKKPPRYGITYVVRGSDSTITYINAYGGIEQQDTSLSGWGLDWQYTLNIGSGTYVSLSAQSKSEYGDITVLIFHDGIEVKRAHSTGAYCVAQVSYIIP